MSSCDGTGVAPNMPEDVSSAMSPDEVPGQIRQWMEDLVRAANGEMTGVTDDKIALYRAVFAVCQFRLDRLAWDSCREYMAEPADMMDRTRQLSASFVNDAANPHTFVIAVVSARDARIRKLRKNTWNLSSDTTRYNLRSGVDHGRSLSGPTSENPYSKLVERLNGTADDAPALGLGYVAAKNRDSDIHISLTQANTEEREWFQTRLPSTSNHVESRVLSINSWTS